MKRLIGIVVVGVVLISSIGAQDEKKFQTLGHFDKVEIGQKISATLVQGESEGIHFDFDGIHPDELRIDNYNGKLHIYLENAKTWEKNKKTYTNGYKHKSSWYGDGLVNVVITYKNLSEVILMGEEDLDINGTITSDKFKLKVYGDSEVYFENLISERFKAKLYGDCTLRFSDGSIQYQKYVMYGDHEVDAENISGEYVKSTNYGDSDLSVNTERLKFTVFGEMKVTCGPGTDVHKGLVFGESYVNQW